MRRPLAIEEARVNRFIHDTLPNGRLQSLTPLPRRPCALHGFPLEVWVCKCSVRSDPFRGSQCYYQTNDVDVWPGHPTHGDGIPNWVEPNLSYAGELYSPTNALTFAGRLGVPADYDDDQLYTCLNAVVWTPRRNGPGGSDPNDWAKPGNNWPE